MIAGQPYANIKKYGNYYKLTAFKYMPGMNHEPTGEINDHKLACNISRAKSRITELALCNPWDFFITATLNKEKYDRTNLNKYQKDFSLFIRHQRSKYNAELKYLLIPELHSDNVSWHMHGLIRGVRSEMLTEFDPREHPLKLIQGGYKNWQDYSDKFGFVSLGIIKNDRAVANYIKKYITKEMQKNVTEVGSRMFYSSQGLAGAEVIKKGTLATLPAQWDFTNDYVNILWISASEVNQYIEEGQDVNKQWLRNTSNS